MDAYVKNVGTNLGINLIKVLTLKKKKGAITPYKWEKYKCKSNPRIMDLLKYNK